MSTYQAIEDITDSSAQTIQTSSDSCWTLLGRKYRRTNKCLSSKAALVVLIWTFLSHFGSNLIDDTKSIVFFIFQSTELGENELPVYTGGSKTYMVSTHVTLSFLFFYPLAGFLADIKFGRFKTVVWSLCLMIIVLIISSTVTLILIICLWTINNGAAQKILAYLLIFFVHIAYLVYSVAFIGVNANIIQFGIDQLYDSPADHQSLFIHWYLWSSHSARLVSRLEIYSMETQTDLRYFFILFIPVLISLTVSVIIALRKRRWFLVDSNRRNPYGLVYKVTKFALSHKIPIRRSAFTYCEDEIPSGLDLGKSKYGGPFTTEQVEDVKAFYGVVKVIMALGPVFALSIAVSDKNSSYLSHLPSIIHENIIVHYLQYYGLLPYLLIMICIPLHVCLIRPLIYYCLPGILKRIGLGIIAMLAALLCSFLLDTAAHREYPEMKCFLSDVKNRMNNTSTADTSSYYYAMTVQYSLGALSTMLFTISHFEFICSQSPNSMKGMLIGLSFAVQGLFQIVIFSMLPVFAQIQSSFPSCGMYYYLMNVGIGIFGFLIFVIVAKRYQFRKRDEICPVYRYAEEYYSRGSINYQEN